MTKIFYRSIILVFTVFIVSTCGKDYLDVPPQGTLDESFYANAEGVFTSLIGTYSLLDGTERTTFGDFSATTGSNWIFGGVTSDNAYKGANEGDQPEINPFETYKWQTNNELLNLKFRSLYEGVKRANTTLRLLNAANDMPDSDRASYEGEALFLRAHFHFEAYKIWGEIPYYFETDETFRKPKSNPKEYLVQDMKQAIAKLPDNQDAPGRITTDVAKAYVGKILLYYHDYEEAKNYFAQVESSGKYRLRHCFYELFNNETENGAETMLAFQASFDPSSTGANTNPDILNYPLINGQFFSDFFKPSQNLVNAFKVDGNGLPLFDSFNDEDLKDTDQVDPRLDWTVGRDGVPYLNWDIHNPNWTWDRDWSGPFSPKKNVYHSTADNVGSGGWGVHFSSLNFHIMRYADVLLMLAECEVKLDNLNEARALVNRIRERAGNCAQGPLNDADSIATVIDDPAITWANYKIGTYDVAWTDQAYARKAVQFERRLELAMEGHRLFDLRRWGVLEEVMNEYIKVEKQKRSYLDGAFVEKKHYLFPFHEEQVNLSKIDGVPQIPQNEGY